MNNLISKEETGEINKEYNKEVKAIINNNKKDGNNKKDDNNQTSQQIPGNSKQGTAVTTEHATESYEQPTETERIQQQQETDTNKQNMTYSNMTTKNDFYCGNLTISADIQHIRTFNTE